MLHFHKKKRGQFDADRIKMSHVVFSPANLVSTLRMHKNVLTYSYLLKTAAFAVHKTFSISGLKTISYTQC